MDTIKIIRQLYKGVSWRNPFINSGFKLIDVPDRIVRTISGREYLPQYSVRVRSRGVANQFGGQLFVEQGVYMVNLLEKYAGLTQHSNVLEIGCGCGCAAIALTNKLTAGTYRGMDIDMVSIDACKNNSWFNGQPFDFEWMDIYSAQYNPKGQVGSSEFVFPYSSESADLVFLFSVFTHMLPRDVERYMSEIHRILKPGGKMLASIFIMDHGYDCSSISFPYAREGYRLHQESVPERAVGYYQTLLEDLCKSSSLKMCGEPILGNWRDKSQDSRKNDVKFGQDLLICKRDKSC